VKERRPALGAFMSGLWTSLALNLTECQEGHTGKPMPTYEYACSACGNQWEQTQRITEPPVELCPKCAKATAHRLISAGTNFILKGGGWYSDLYASPKAEKAPAASDKAEKPTADAAAPADKSAPKAASTDGSSPAPAASSPPPSSASSS